MTDQPPTNEQLEGHVKVLDAYYELLPDCDDKRHARHWLERSAEHAYKARETYRPDPAAE